MARKTLLQGVFAVGVAGAVLLSGACGMVTKQYADNEAVGQAIRSVLVANDSGAVKIRTGGTTRVHRQVHHNSDRPGATHRVDGAVLILESCPVRNCWVDYDVVVPEGVTVRGKIESGDVEIEGAESVNVSAGSGDVTVRKVSGKVTVAADSGRVELVDIGDNVAVDVSSGSVKAVGLGGSADIGTSSGSIEVALVEVGNVRARADSGQIQVAVPQGRYRVEAVVDSGDLDNGIGSDVEAANSVDIQADSGDVSIRYT
ncbi:DUF4097 family beta strand repeat-containing protein [Actinokineospora sp.]|uniref:DUF4097 family beta strand repeat-containing protein n=1 Tax=Actinokineospora sp. TaxID=1872133 RepID=UPI003D6C185F